MRRVEGPFSLFSNESTIEFLERYKVIEDSINEVVVYVGLKSKEVSNP